jgi:two-component system, chemotaxis family, CheB/CheR fusion protein
MDRKKTRSNPPAVGCETKGSSISESRQVLARTILAFGERELERVGRDLHDSLGQLLTGVSMFHRVLTNALAAKQLSEAVTAQKEAELLEETRAEVRRIARGLNPLGNEPHALLAALQDYAGRIEGVHKMRCAVHCPEPVTVPTPEIATHLYRIVQEAVGNAVQHGSPEMISIALTERRGMILLEVRDNGSGFTKPATDHMGLGLKIMQARAEAISARMQISRTKPHGTRVRLQLPAGQGS